MNFKPRQVLEYLEKHNEREVLDLQIKYNLIHNVGVYVMTAYHNPKNYPDKAIQVFKGKDEEVKVQSEQEQDMLITIMQNSIKNKNGVRT